MSTENPEKARKKHPKRFSGEVKDATILEEMEKLAQPPYSFNYLAEEAFRIALPALKQKVHLSKQVFLMPAVA